MARLIDADKLRERHCNGCNEDIREMCRVDPVCASLMWIDEEPTVDAVPVVRCRDCKHYVWDDFDGCYVCLQLSKYVKLEFWCAHGERKDND